MTLLEEGEVERLKQKQIKEYNPTLKSLAAIQGAIETLIDLPTLNADEKIQILNHLQSKFSALYNIAKVTTLHEPSPHVTVLAPTGTKVETVDAPEKIEANSKDVKVEKAVAPEKVESGMQSAEPAHWPELSELKLLPQYDKKYRKLVEFLNKYPHVVSKSSQGEISVHGKTLPDSSFSDLIRGLYVRPSNLNIHGQNEFHDALSTLKLPPAFISSKEIKAKLAPETKDHVTVHEKSEEPVTENTSEISPVLIPQPLKRKLRPNHHSVTKTGTGKRKHPPPGKKPRILRLYH